VQILNHRVNEIRSAALWIQILIPQNQSSTAFSRTLRRNPERPRMPNMKQPRRRRRQSPAIRSSMELM
jgi:hypothetical protein